MDSKQTLSLTKVATKACLLRFGLHSMKAQSAICGWLWLASRAKQRARQTMQQAVTCRMLPEQKRRCYCCWAWLTGAAHAVSRGSLAAAVLSDGRPMRASAAWPESGMPPALAGMLVPGDIALPACYLHSWGTYGLGANLVTGHSACKGSLHKLDLCRGCTRA